MLEGEKTKEEQVPVFKSWKSWYWLTVIILVMQVLLYFGISKIFE